MCKCLFLTTCDKKIIGIMGGPQTEPNVASAVLSGNEPALNRCKCSVALLPLVGGSALLLVVTPKMKTSGEIITLTALTLIHGRDCLRDHHILMLYVRLLLYIQLGFLTSISLCCFAVISIGMSRH